ncbi:MAG TPA: lysophospholipid acyltransferase family protein [Acidimicrobiales bacterium]|nr:lysophospholipid acyltransferase family protein [Acidimicrobiales bacterium]
MSGTRTRAVARGARARGGTLRSVLAAPTWPGSVERPERHRQVGVDYDTAWSRSPAARLARAVIVDNVTRPFVRLVASPRVVGRELLEPLRGPVIFAANHSSHLDTAIVLSCLPSRFRHHAVVAAASDYFFDRRWKGDLWSLTLGTIPMERTRVNRRSADLAAALIDDGWSLVIFPEGGRTEDGWGQEFRGGAAYLAKRCDVPVVPVHLHGVRPILPKGGSRLRPGDVAVRFGAPLRPHGAGDTTTRDEDARRFSARIEHAVAALADEAETDWWSARRRAADGRTPDPRGPDVAAWRRGWTLPDSRRTRPPGTREEPPAPW